MTGFANYATTRLVITQVALRTMEALLVMMVLITIFLCLYNLQPIPIHSLSIKHISTVLSMNGELSNLLHASGRDVSKRSFGGYLFSAAPSNRQSIVVQLRRFKAENPHFWLPWCTSGPSTPCNTVTGLVAPNSRNLRVQNCSYCYGNPHIRGRGSTLLSL